MTKAQMREWKAESVNQALAELAKDPEVKRILQTVVNLAGHVA